MSIEGLLQKTNPSEAKMRVKAIKMKMMWKSLPMMVAMLRRR